MFLDLLPVLEDGLTEGQVEEEAAAVVQLLLTRQNTLLQFIGRIFTQLLTKVLVQKIQ
jgi:hypothetical protein